MVDLTQEEYCVGFESRTRSLANMLAFSAEMTLALRRHGAVDERASLSKHSYEFAREGNIPTTQDLLQLQVGMYLFAFRKYWLEGRHMLKEDIYSTLGDLLKGSENEGLFKLVPQDLENLFSHRPKWGRRGDQRGPPFEDTS